MRLNQFNSPVTKVGPKPGYLTTEFWVQLILQVLFFLNSANWWNFADPRYTIIAQGVMAAAYAVARGLAKITPGPAAVQLPAPPPVEPAPVTTTTTGKTKA